jgi:hypothetical protein
VLCCERECKADIYPNELDAHIKLSPKLIQHWAAFYDRISIAILVQDNENRMKVPLHFKPITHDQTELKPYRCQLKDMLWMII